DGGTPPMVMGELTQETEVLVIGSGPGGYAAAFRAADLGLDVTMVDMQERPGGECLFRGCIPSKTLLYLSELMHDAERAEPMGLTFERPKIDLNMIRNWKQQVIDTMADGLITLSNKRGVQLIKGRAVFEGSDSVRLQGSDVRRIKFSHAILATGSRPLALPDSPFQEEGRVMDSAGALELKDIPESLFVYGGGYVALELGAVYASLGSRVTLAVRSDRLIRGADPDLAAPLIHRLGKIFDAIHYDTQIADVKETDTNVTLKIEGKDENWEQTFDRALIAIGRVPSSRDIGLETTKVKVNERGYVIVDETRRTSDERIFAIGDVAGGALLAHKAFREGKVAAEVIAGQPSAFDARAIPAVIYTDPQVAWCGLTEEQARKQNRPVDVERYPWKFSGRATAMGLHEGLTKIIIDPDTGRILGMGVAGRNTEGLISEGALAIEMGALAEDMALTIHPHPTLSETVGEVADVFLGGATHILPRQRKKGPVG
ncbi:MAG: dihydrolipoyl dehydrogenase, partial [Desulfatiglandaceae bacterium]